MLVFRETLVPYQLLLLVCSIMKPLCLDSATTPEIVERLDSQGVACVAELFEQAREKLRRFIMHRMDSRLLARIDWDDVLQEAFLVVQRRYKEYIASPTVPFYIWLRSLTGQVLIDLHRKHLKMQRRSVSREVAMEQQLPFQSSVAALGELLAASGTSPSGAVERNEQAARLQRALEELPEIDREVLVLRHLEQLTNGEVASIMGIDKSAATKRYVRALKRLGERMQSE